MEKPQIKTIAVLTSGGDSPGMNAAIRAVVRTGIARGLKVWGIQRGYAGLLEGAFREMDASSVGNILQHGGTILQTSRCPEFHQADTRKEAVNLLRRKKIDGLIVIGGDGSFNGAHDMWLEHQYPVVGIPGTIDNDISGTEYTIGFDTAVQTAIEAVDKIRDTASSHARTFIVEVMGRRSPAIALHTGVCTGAENIVLPSQDVNPAQIAADIQRGVKRGKNSSIIIVAEGEKPGLISYQIQESLKKDHKIDAHVCVLGHIQRGGHPSAIDRFLAARMGYEAVERIINGDYPVATVYVDGHVKVSPLKDCLKKRVESAPGHMELARTLSI